MRNKYIFTLLAIFTITISFGQIITDRPDQTESSSTVGKGNLQLESGILVGFEDNGLDIERQILAPTNLFRYGITKAFELRILSQFESLKRGESNTQGISDLEVGTKIQLLQNPDLNTEIAFLSHLVIPTGTRGLSGEAYGTINKLSIAHELTKNMSVGYNLGYNYFSEDSGDLSYSVALGIAVNDKVGVYIEPYGELANLTTHVANFDAGMTYLANENLQFDLSFGTGINNKYNYISFGFSWLLLQNQSAE